MSAETIAESLQKENERLRARIAELESWKRQQLEVESGWSAQRVGNLCGVKHGHSIRQAIEPFIVAQQARIAELEAKAADGTDWKAIAMALGQRVNWAISNISERGTGLVLNTTTGKSRHWKEYMAEALRMIPGLTINDDILAAHCLPPGEKRKRLKQLAKQAEQEGSHHEQG